MIRGIFRLAIHGENGSGRLGVKSITIHLNGKEIRTRDDKKFCASAIHNILTC